MPKKCVPGVLCIEYISILLIILTIILCFYIYNNIIANSSNKHNVLNNQKNNCNRETSVIITPNRQDIFNDPYVPPVKPNVYMSDCATNNIPININTRRLPSSYHQIGILTQENNTNMNMILPLMGRLSPSGRDNWQYYTVSGSGALNTRLPVTINNKDCSSEYGCKEIYNGDTVFVKGYNDTFIATIYENNTFHYLPVI